jgi:hypothetical protein
MSGMTIALVIVAATSTGFFAHMYPKVFAVVGNLLSKAVAYGILFCIVWDMAVDSARQVSVMALDDDRELIAKIEAAIASVMFSTTFIVSAVAVLAYLMFLKAIPSLLEVANGN